MARLCKKLVLLGLAALCNTATTQTTADCSSATTQNACDTTNCMWEEGRRLDRQSVLSNNPPALTWLTNHADISGWFSEHPPSKIFPGRPNQQMCEKHILPDSFVQDQVDWFTHGQKQGEWLLRYSAQNPRTICWGEGDSAEQWFDHLLSGDGCNRPWMVASEDDVPISSFQQFTQEAPAVMGLDPVILEYCRNISHDSQPAPSSLINRISKALETTGRAQDSGLAPMNILENNLLAACSKANRNILRVSARAQRKTSWDMCENVRWVVCAAQGKLPKQGKTIEFVVPPGSLDGNLLPKYREYRSNILRWSANYEIDVMAWTFYLNEICFLSLLCDNAEEMWTLRQGEQWTCQHSAMGGMRLRESLQRAYRSATFDNGLMSMARGLQGVSGGHVSGGHVSGGHVSGGHVSGGHVSGGHVSGGHVSGGHVSGGHVSGASGGTCKDKAVVVLSTTSTADVAAGATTIALADITGIVAGQMLEISDGTNTESHEVESVSAARRLAGRRLAAGTVTLKTPLTNAFTAGATIKITEAPAQAPAGAPANLDPAPASAPAPAATQATPAPKGESDNAVVNGLHLVSVAAILFVAF